MTLIDHVSPRFFLSSKSKGSNFLLGRDVFIDFSAKCTTLMMNSWCQFYLHVAQTPVKLFYFNAFWPVSIHGNGLF